MAVLEKYWKNTIFSLKCPGKDLEFLWSMEFGFLWQSASLLFFFMFDALYGSLKNWNSERGHMNK